MNSPSNDIDPSLDGQWAITGALDETGDLVDPVPGSDPFMRFGDDGLTGNTGCNSFFATVDALPGGTWSSGEIGMTLIGCPPDLAAQESAITNAIASATSWSIEGDTAELSASGISLLTMDRWEQELAGEEWLITGINNGKGGVTSVLAGTEARVRFGEQGRVIGTAGCNNLMGAYVVENARLTISEVAATRKFCPSPEGLMDQERQMIDALTSAATFSIDGNRLTIRDTDGAIQITATRAGD